MSAYHLGQLFGTLFVAVLAGAFAYRLFRSPTKWKRMMALPLAAVALLYVVLLVVRAGGAERADFQAGFMSGCMKKCSADPALQATCRSACDCQYAKLSEREDVDQLMEKLIKVRSEADLDPKLIAELRETSQACLSPEAYDLAFRSGCLGSCKGDHCDALCGCAIGKLREGMEPAAGTRWLMANIDAKPPSAAGQAKLNAAIQACAPIAKPQP